jgi:Ca2+-transporting ATPase
VDATGLPAELPLRFETDGVTGLTEGEASERLRRDGPNELQSQKPRRLVHIAMDVAREPMFLLLVAAGGLYLVTGKPADALMLLGFVFVVMAITIVQERRTERALEALKDLSSPRALVIRDGRARRVRRSRDRRRGRPGAGRRAAAARNQRLRRRVAADGRVGAGAQAAVGAHRRPGPAGR